MNRQPTNNTKMIVRECIDKIMDNKPEFNNQKLLAKELGCTEAQISNWKRGVCCPDLQNFIKLCQLGSLKLQF